MKTTLRTLDTGTILNKHYKILKTLGSDSYSISYLAENITFNSQCIIKEFFPSSTLRDNQNRAINKSDSLDVNFDKGLNSFYEEGLLLADVNHPNIVKVEATFKDNGTAYVVMPYVSSYTLKDWMQDNPYPSAQKIEDVFYPILEGLNVVHQKGILHTDIQPENIVFSEDDTPILTNFANARFDFTTKTKSLDTALTAPYAPIELYTNTTNLSASTDLYSISACMYQAITDQKIPEAIDRSKGLPLLPLTDIEAIKSRYPKDLLTTIDRNLAFKASDRNQSVEDLQHGLLGVNPSRVAPSKEVNSSNQSPLLKKSLIGILALIGIAGLIYAGMSIFNSTSSSGGSTSQSSSPDSISTPKLDPNDYRNIKAVMNIQGSNTIGSVLMPKLLETYYHNNNLSPLGIASVGLEDKKFIYIGEDGEKHAIDLGSHGSSTGITALLNQQAQLAMSSRQIKAEEVKQLADAGLGSMTDDAQEIVIGLDGIAVIVSQSNPIQSLTIGQLTDIFTGRITNWSQVGGDDQPINLYVRDEKSGTRDTFDSLVMKTEKGAKATAFEDSAQLSDTVSNDAGAIGYIGLPYINSAKALAIAASADSIALLPTSFTISTEDYPLSRRLYLYLPKKADSAARHLANFTLSKEGQTIVRNVGFIDVMPDLVKVSQERCDDSNNAGYKTLCQSGKRMDTNFRFSSGSSELDNKAKQSLRRVVERLNQTRVEGTNVKFALVGFTDNKGRECVNNQIAVDRATIVAKELEKYGVKADIVQGMGAEAPVGDNSTDLGRDKNRRVELWTLPSNQTPKFPDMPKC